ncbi:hypothetical protein, partial [Dialister invisus]|uniref:hypothetical protein n=1 Tax=Dialister invisus TaxID=218538 RepID=UPI0026597562
GVSVKLGQGSGLPISRTAMAREINTLKVENEDLKADNQDLKADNRILHEKMEEKDRQIEFIMQQLEELRKAQAAR